MLFFITKIYASIQELFHQKFNLNIRGLGYLLRLQKEDRIINFQGKKLFFNHKVADNYSRLINGRFNEPETHLFINSILNSYPDSSVQFIEVGANIGEFLIDYAGNKKILNSIFFEPQAEQFNALLKTKEINEFDNAEIINKAVSNVNGVVKFASKEKNTTDAGIINNITSEGFKIPSATLDTVLRDVKQNTILLIDAEGEELNIIKGGKIFITNAKPVIVFEYNHITKNHFPLEEVKQELGNEYKLYRLNSDGKLDVDFSKTWNLVALPLSFSNKRELFD
ncbi:MAG: hypothetical protein B6D44_00365 [Ignavibacteriales bacterium UTCHB2]|nr:MAG: hypothetical protein B6D44_00365 [Ignavibacteriales bacterium UTCHB2]